MTTKKDNKNTPESLGRIPRIFPELKTTIVIGEEMDEISARFNSLNPRLEEIRKERKGKPPDVALVSPLLEPEHRGISRARVRDAAPSFRYSQPVAEEEESDYSQEE